MTEELKRILNDTINMIEKSEDILRKNAKTLDSLYEEINELEGKEAELKSLIEKCKKRKEEMEYELHYGEKKTEPVLESPGQIKMCD